MRTVLIALCGLMLTACNMVVSREPLFTQADAAGSAPVKDGWWVSPKPTDDGRPCTFDLEADARDWPPCAEGQLILGGRMIDTEDGDAPQDFLLTGGDPRIMQIGVKEQGLNLYAYGALKVRRKDSAGRMTAFVSWPVECGPPPPEPKEPKGPGDYATRAPVAGLKVDRETGNCWTTDPGQVRRAAAASEGWTKDKKDIRWVREMRPGEDKPKPKPPEAAAPAL